MKGPGKFETRIGQNGKPLKGDPELPPKQRDIVNRNITKIRKNIQVSMERHKNNGC